MTHPAHAAVILSGVTKRYGRQLAVNDVSTTIRSGAITGLIGRNGAGKTTLLRLIAGYERPSSGSVTVLGANLFDNAWAATALALTREDQIYPEVRVADVLTISRAARPGWDEERAADLVAAFDLPLKRKVKKLSRGMRTALGVTVGLAATTEILLMDEPTAGLDPVARQIFYDALLASYAEHPRTIVLSTHLIDEVAGLVEDVMVMQRGRVALQGPAAEVAERIIMASGSRAAVEELAARHDAAVQAIGGRARAVIHGGLTDADRAAAAAAGVQLEPLSLQEFLVEQDRARIAEGAGR